MDCFQNHCRIIHLASFVHTLNFWNAVSSVVTIICCLTPVMIIWFTIVCNNCEMFQLFFSPPVFATFATLTYFDKTARIFHIHRDPVYRMHQSTKHCDMVAEKGWIYQNIWKVDLNCVAQTPSYHKTLQLINLFCAEPRNFNLGFWNKIVLEFLLSKPDIIFIFLGFEGVWRLITFLHARRSQCYLLNMNSEHVANIWKSPDPATKSNYP